MKYLKIYETFSSFVEKETEKILEFIRLVAETKGNPKSNYRLIIDDNINEFSLKVKYINKACICFEIVEGDLIYKLEQFPLEKLKSLEKYLKKKYPEIAIGKEWGFFDLKEGVYDFASFDKLKIDEQLEEFKKIIDFFKLLVEAKGVDGEWGKRIVVNAIITLCKDGIIQNGKFIEYYHCKIKLLKNLYEDLKKKYPEVATAKEWGFFDLKEKLTKHDAKRILNDIATRSEIMEFIKLLIESKGTKIPPKFYHELEIDDYINGVFIKTITPVFIWFKTKKMRYQYCSLELLTNLYEYLKKKYPEVATGKEWGFFDLKEMKFTIGGFSEFNKEKEKLLEFIRFVVGIKGVGSGIVGKKLVINDTLSGFSNRKIRHITKDYLCVKDGGIGTTNIWVLDVLSLEKLKSLEEYLKKKYPELATGKEWGFFDLKENHNILPEAEENATLLVKYLKDNAVSINGWNFTVDDRNDIFKWYKNENNIIMSYINATPIADKSFMIIRPNHDERKQWREYIDIPKTEEERKKFRDWYFNELMPNILYIVENEDNAIEFIKLLVDSKGTKKPGKIYLSDIEVNDIKYIKKTFRNTRVHLNNPVPDKLYSNFFCTSYNLENYPLTELYTLYEYLKKKYPEVATGKEWGFFDLENTK